MATDEEVEAYLAHHGVKGMHWGVKKAGPSSSEIKTARTNQHQRKLAVNRARRSGDQAAVEKAKQEYNTHPDKAVAELKTAGEKAAAAPGKAVGKTLDYAIDHPIKSFIIADAALTVYAHRGEIAGTAVIAGKVGSYLVKQAFAKDSPASSYASLGRQVVQGFVVN